MHVFRGLTSLTCTRFFQCNEDNSCRCHSVVRLRCASTPDLDLHRSVQIAMIESRKEQYRSDTAITPRNCHFGTFSIVEPATISWATTRQSKPLRCAPAIAICLYPSLDSRAHIHLMLKTIVNLPGLVSARGRTNYSLHKTTHASYARL